MNYQFKNEIIGQYQFNSGLWQSWLAIFLNKNKML